MDKENKADRRTRLEKVLRALLAQPTFTLRDLKKAIPFEKPPFVTRIVHELERDGSYHRPRERLLVHGAESLKLSELLAVLIRSGQPGEGSPHCMPATRSRLVLPITGGLVSIREEKSRNANR